MDPNQSLMDQFRNGNMDAFEESNAGANNPQMNPYMNYQNNANMGYMGNDQYGFNGHNQMDQDNQFYNPQPRYSQMQRGSQYSQYNPAQYDQFNGQKQQQMPPGGMNHANTLYQPQTHDSNVMSGMNQHIPTPFEPVGKSSLPQMTQGVANSFKDLMDLRTQEPPKLQVCEPQIKGGTAGKHHIYKVEGYDSQGPIEIFRRFSHFYELRETLFHRFLGLYIPPIPEKKSVGNKELVFVEERCAMLDRFIKEVCSLPYLFESAELQAFLRPEGDVEKTLAGFPKMTTDQLLSRLRSVMPVNEMANDYKLKEHDHKINDFVKDCREFIEHLKRFKKQIKLIVPIKEQEVNHYKDFVDFLVKYEDLNVKKQTPDQPFQANLLSGESGTADFKTQLTETTQNLKNPFKHIRNWVKGEIMELGALMESISRKEGIENQKIKAIKKVKEQKEYADKLSTGKFSFKGMFKSKDGKATETQNTLQSITQGEKDIQNYDVIKNFLIIYLAEVAIPAFKHHKMKNYINAMKAFCGQEIANSQWQQECWSQFLESIKKVQIK